MKQMPHSTRIPLKFNIHDQEFNYLKGLHMSFLYTALEKSSE